MDSTAYTIKPDRLKEKENDLVYSYMTLRNLIGLCGMILPIALALTTRTSPGDKAIESSISAYYYTSNGDLLVAVMCVLGAFLFTYKGYDVKENILSSVTAICGLGVAFSPTAADCARQSFSIHTALPVVPEIFGIERHLIFAGLFFITLSIISLLCFPQTDVINQAKGIMTKKNKRNIIFKVCGWIMFFCVAVMIPYNISDKIKSMFGDFPFIFVFESIAIEAFAASWLTKGETFYPDGEHYLVEGYKTVSNSFKKAEKQ